MLFSLRFVTRQAQMRREDKETQIVRGRQLLHHHRPARSNVVRTGEGVSEALF